MKKSVGPDTYIYPLPTVVVSTYDKAGTPNMMTASWAGIVSSSPVTISISLRKATYSYHSIIERKAFTISIPSQKHIVEMDYVGTKSGKKENKFETTGLTPVSSDLVDAPYVGEFPVVLECKLLKYDDLGLHTMFVAEVVDVKIDESCLRENGKPDIPAINPIAYAHGDREYYEVGEYLGKANRLWKGSVLNEKVMDNDKREAAEFIFDYYKKLDNSEPLEAFLGTFDWDNFIITNGNKIIDSYDAYRSWYDEVVTTFFDKKHIINNFKVETTDDGYQVEIDMYFRARSWEKGTARSTRLEVTSKITWSLKRSEDGSLKAVTYQIFI